MWITIKRLFLGFFLIFMASAVLLISDWQRRQPESKSSGGSMKKKWRIGLVQLVDAPPMEEAFAGVIAGFKEAGLQEGTDFELRVRNAQGDMAVLPGLVEAAITEGTDLFFTITSPALQNVVRKIQDRPVVFCLAVDPKSWNPEYSDERHIPNVTGVYVSSPFDEMIRVIRECVPGVKRLGTVYTPSEANSLYIKERWTEIANRNGLEIVAAPVASSVEVGDAAQSICARGIDAFCQIGDNASTSAFASIIHAAKQSRIPLFCFSSFQARQGAVVSVANDHFDSGREAAGMIARIMRGEDPSSIPWQPARTVKIAVNPQAAKDIGFSIPKSLSDRANETIGQPLPEQAKRPDTTSLHRSWNIHLIEFTNILDVEDSEQGIRDGFREAGLQEGRDFKLQVKNSQGDMAALSTLVDSAVTEGADLLMTMSTPTLQAALQRAGKRPIVFTLVASAVAAGAGESNERHLPNVTGVVTTSAYRELIAVFRECMPGARRIGSLFVPGETNSVYNKDRTLEAAREAGLEMVILPVNTSSEVSDAATALTERGIDAILQIAGNLTAASFPSIVRAAERRRLPIFAFQSNQAIDGASVVVARDYYDGGRESALIAARVMRGENPLNIPFQPLSTTRLYVNLRAASAIGLKIPESIRKRATKVIQ